jgi:hypothetical protein
MLAVGRLLDVWRATVGVCVVLIIPHVGGEVTVVVEEEEGEKEERVSSAWR